MAIEDDGRVSR